MNDCKCGGLILDAGGELVCGSCGMVMGYEQEAPTATLPGEGHLEFGPTTIIGMANKDYAGKPLSISSLAAKLRMRNQRTQTYNRTLPKALGQISKLRDVLGMSQACAEYAAYIFRKATESGFLTGRVVRHCAAASVMLACRKHGMNRTMADIMEATGITRRDLFRTYRQLCDRLDVQIPVPDPVAYIARIANVAGVDEETRREALDILSTVDRSEIAGKDPMGLAASALYMSCVRRGEVIYRRDIAEAAGVAETTLSNRYNALVAALANQARRDNNSIPVGEIGLPNVRHITGMGHPVELIYKDGTRERLKSWTGILSGVADWLVRNKHLDESHCPVPIGKNNSILNVKPVHQNGTAFQTAKPAGHLYVFLNVNGTNAVRYAIKLIEAAGLDPADFKACFKQK